MSEARALEFTVWGQPVPKGRPRVFGRRAITPARTVDYEASVRFQARAALAKCAGTSWPLEARYAVQVAAYFADKRTRDLDNVAKAVLDALNGVAFADDSRVDDLHVKRLFDKAHPRVDVRIVLLGAPC